MKRVVLLFLLLLPVATAQVDNYNNFSTLLIEVSLDSHVTKTSGTAAYMLGRLSYYPNEFEHQKILSQSFSSNPSATINEEDGVVSYRWDQDADDYQYGVVSTIQIENALAKIYQKEEYPSPVPSDIAVYTLASDYIDIVPAIEEQAEAIVGGEDDVYQIAFLLANWTQKSITYNLSTLTAKAVYPSSWVLENREGVCDEITNLFISMVRSRGIPARFVSGLVYTNLLYDFGPHGWAEVYIDGQWVPFDVTFGQYGWIDPSHIKFKDSVDSGEASVNYEWVGANVAVQTDEIDITSAVTAAHGEVERYVDLIIVPLVDRVGPGSFIPVQVTLRNLYDFYVPVRLTIPTAPGLADDNLKTILLEPNEEASMFWLVTVPSDLVEGYVYTSTVEVLSMYGDLARTDVHYAESFPVVTRDEAEALLVPLIVEEAHPFLDDVTLTCSPDKELYYTYETATVTCAVAGDYAGGTLCLVGNCLSAVEVLSWQLPLDNVTGQRIPIVASKGDRQRIAYVDIAVLEEPNLRIENIAPLSMAYSDTVNLTFDIYVDSPVQNVSLTLGNYGTLVSDALDGKLHVSLPVRASQFYDQMLHFDATYSDTLGNGYTYTLDQLLTISDVPWYGYILKWFSQFIL